MAAPSAEDLDSGMKVNGYPPKMIDDPMGSQFSPAPAP